jgi:hypothetical protein
MVDLGQKGYAMRAFFFCPKLRHLLGKIKKTTVLFYKIAFRRVFVLFNNFFVQAFYLILL